MALTMTRTRTQTTLTKLAEMVANVQGELEFLEGLLAGAVPAGGGVGASVPDSVAPEVRTRLTARRLKLVGDRDALYTTIRQFEGSIDPAGIGRSEEWRKRYGRCLGEAGLVRRYSARATQLGGHS